VEDFHALFFTVFFPIPAVARSMYLNMFAHVPIAYQAKISEFDLVKLISEIVKQFGLNLSKLINNLDIL
jgi:hypothetical protein